MCLATHIPRMITHSTHIAELLNLGNPADTPPAESDVTVIGAGIHGLIYRYDISKYNALL